MKKSCQKPPKRFKILPRNPWRTRQKKKKRCRRPQIIFESAESEIEALSDAYAPPSGAQAKSQYSQPNEYPKFTAVPHPQGASNPMFDFDRRAIIVYGISPSNNPSPSSRVEHDIPTLRLYFNKILAEDEPVSVCKAYCVGLWEQTTIAVHAHWKWSWVANWILNYYLAARRNWHLLYLMFFSPNLFPTRALEVSGAKGRNSAQVLSGRGESCHPGPQNYITAHHTEIISMAGVSKTIRFPKLVAYKKLFALHTNACSLVPKRVNSNYL